MSHRSRRSYDHRIKEEIVRAGDPELVHAVIDNFSRKILAWTVADRLDAMNTHTVLTRAAGNVAASAKAEVFMDWPTNSYSRWPPQGLRARQLARGAKA